MFLFQLNKISKMHLKIVYLLSFCFAFSFNASAQEEGEAFFIKSIYDHALTESNCYEWLTHLSSNIGARLSGSSNYDMAATYTASVLKSMDIDTLFTQGSEVDHWLRGTKTEVMVILPDGRKWPLKCLALGKSIGNGLNPVMGEIIEVHSLDEVEKLGRENIEGKIVFYNRPMDPKQVRTFNAYGGAVDQRVFGASKASEYGAVAALVRSMTTRKDDVPHTGTMSYAEGVDPIPGIAISTNDADNLSKMLAEQTLSATVVSDSKDGGKKNADNVIAEIRGSEFPEEIILVGGHLDSWDVGGGAHDDGSGCVHAMQVIQTLLALDYKPKRTIRCVLFANEENGLAGAREYARISNEKGEFHLAALESDSGGFTPRGFSVDGHPEILQGYAKKISDWVSTYLGPYGLMMSTGGSGADINPLKSQQGILIGLRTDSQRYFDFHHTENDRINVVNPRELQLGAAAMTSLVYLIDQYGLK